MSTFTQLVSQTFHVVSCYFCGSNFGISNALYHRAATRAEGVVYCPSCGKSFCWGESDEKKKIRQLERELQTANARAETQKRAAENARDERDAKDRQLTATKGVVTRIKNRVGKGVCPCCNRTFQNLLDHMKTQHPDFIDKE